MTTQISGDTGVSKVQDSAVTTAALAAGAVTPVKTQSGASPSCVKVNTGNGHGSTATKIRRFTNVVLNAGTDITYTDSATDGASFLINVTGVYAISYSDAFTAANSYGAGLSLNSSQLTTDIGAISLADILGMGGAATNGSATACVTQKFLAGDVIRPHGQGLTGSSVPAVFTITRVA